MLKLLPLFFKMFRLNEAGRKRGRLHLEGINGQFERQTQSDAVSFLSSNFKCASLLYCTR